MKLNGRVLKAVFIVVVLGAAVAGGYAILTRSDMALPTILRQSPGPRLFMSMEGFRFSESEDGRVSWRVRARTADLYDSKEARLKDLEITFIAPDNKDATLIGEQGILDTVTGNGSVSRVNHEVRIVSSDGYLLTTDSLFWKAQERQVVTQDAFKLLGSEIYLEGKGLSANVDMRTITVNSNVKAVLQE